MELFNKLGAEIENLWCARNYDEMVFPEIAAQKLKEANLPEKVSAWEVIEWTLVQNYLPDQRDLHGRFGDPPITIYNSPRFYIDVYFWLEGTTAIHQHAFCGAFQVLHGSSLHSWYEFERHESINIFTEIGEMNLKVCELLNVGDVQEIRAGRQYVHSLFHLEQPSATVCVRTHRSPLFLPQFEYHKPFLAIDPFFDEPNTTKKMQTISALIRAKYPETDRLIGEWLRTADFQTSFTILSTLRTLLRSNQLDKIFGLDGSQNRFDIFFEIVREKHGERANILPKVFAHQSKTEEIVRRRSFITEPEHRFFLALLMNVEGRERIFSLIKERFPESEPLEKVLDWTYDLANTRVLGLNIPNAVGIENFGDLDLFVLESMLKDLTNEETEKVLQTEYGMQITEEVKNDLENKREQIRNSVIFDSLLRK